MRMLLLLSLFVMPVYLNAADDHTELLKAHNEARAKVGLPALKMNAKDAAFAKKHSEAQAAKGGSCYHSREVLSRPGDVEWSENVFHGSKGATWDDRFAHKAWMDSKGHRGNILDKRWTTVGFGKAEGRNGTYYTAVFRE